MTGARIRQSLAAGAGLLIVFAAFVAPSQAMAGWVCLYQDVACNWGQIPATNTHTRNTGNTVKSGHFMHNKSSGTCKYTQLRQLNLSTPIPGTTGYTCQSQTTWTYAWLGWYNGPATSAFINPNGGVINVNGGVLHPF